MKTDIAKSVGRVLALACLALLPVALAAQEASKPASKAAADDSASKWDIFVGYSYLAPIAKINGVPSTYPGHTYGQINFGAIASVTRYFNKNLGVQIEGSEHIQSEDWLDYNPLPIYNSNDNFAGGSAGLIYRIPGKHITPFVHALGGMEQVGSLYLADAWGGVGTAGGGLDLKTPLFNHRLSFRLFQADYQYIYVGSAAINTFRLSTGAVYGAGSIAPPPPLTLACSANAVSGNAVFPGEPLSLTANASQLDPKLSAIYSWSGAGVTGKGASASVDTAQLAPGSYSATVTVKEGKAGKEGMKAGESAQCAANFVVKAFEPPTVSCFATPATVKPGELVTIRAAGLSPQSRPLSYSYTASAGRVLGDGAMATYYSTGAPTGIVGINCTVSDDKGQTATAATTVNIASPYIPPPPHTQALCAIGFSKDKKRPTRVDNEAKACLDDVALNLQKRPDAKAVVVGSADAAEKARELKALKMEAGKRNAKPVVDAAAERAVNTKDYLVTEKGIDPARVTVMTSSIEGQNVEEYLVPAGASFTADVRGVVPVNEATVKPKPRKPLAARKHAKAKVKKSARKTAQ
jgi:hypothetical protein